MIKRISKQEKKKIKIRNLMCQAGWGLMIGALLFFPAAIMATDVRQATSYLQTGMTLMVIGAIVDVCKRFI